MMARPLLPALIGLALTASATAPRNLPARPPDIDAALAALAPHVRRLSRPDALRVALRAYFAYRGTHPGRVRNPYLFFVDYGLDSRVPRGYVFDMGARRVVDGPFTVAHGRGSADGRFGVPVRFSNASGSAASSLGLYLTGRSYTFTGHSGGRSYSSLGLRLDGLSGRYNGAARARGVVVHGAPYVTASGAGRSEGCPAMELRRARRLIPLLANGGLVFLYSPNDDAWLRQDPWAGSRAAPPGSPLTPPSSR